MFTDVFILNKYYCIVNCYQLREKIRNLNITYLFNEIYNRNIKIINILLNFFYKNFKLHK